MANFSIGFQGDRKAILQISALAARAANLRPAFQSIGEYMLRSTRSNFDTSTAPNGSPWAPLKKSTVNAKTRSQQQKTRGKRGRLKKRTRANPADILKDTFLLRDTVSYSVALDHVAIGTNQRYGVFHQEGTKWMAKRQFLGVSIRDRSEIQAILTDHLSKP
jgi:phage virion morphogenesis protein